MRVLLFSGYSHPAHHRKVELIADEPEVELWHILPPGNGKISGRHPSANGRRSYQVRVAPILNFGAADDPHRTVHTALGRALADFRPDVIHVEHEQESLMALQISLLRAWRYPQTPLIIYTWQNLLRQRRWPVRLLSAITRRAAQHIVCANQEAVTVLRRQGFQGATSIMPLFGLDRRYFTPRRDEARRAALNLHGIVAGYIGRLTPEKGVDVLLRAAAQATTPLQLLLIGHGPAKASLQQLAATLGIAERCLFLDAVPYEAVAGYLNLLDLLVLPSRTTRNWKEQFGRVLVEAMACQVPVIGSQSGAIPEVIGDAGRLFAEGDAAALAHILDALAVEPALRQELGERGYRRAWERYAVERLSEQMLTIWRATAPAGAALKPG